MPEFDDWVKFPLLAVLFGTFGALLWVGKILISMLRKNLDGVTEANVKHASANERLGEGVNKLGEGVVHLGTVAESSVVIARDSQQLIREIHAKVVTNPKKEP